MDEEEVKKIQVDPKVAKCCFKIMGKCDSEQLKFLCTPLETTYPEIYGKLDRSQELILEKYDKQRAPLIVIENASDILRQIRDGSYFIEDVMEKILLDTKALFVFLGSYSFKQRDGGVPINLKAGRNSKLIKELREKLSGKKITKAILHVAMDLGGVGHYGIIIMDEDKLIVFDSSLCDENQTYIDDFSSIAKAVFDMEPYQPTCPTVEQCLQLTGGFVQSYHPKFGSEKLRKWWLQVQSLNSQDHFCYMWAIWYAHLYITQGLGKISQVIADIRMRKIHPIIVVKKYIWGLVNNLYPDNDSLLNIIHHSVRYDSGKEVPVNTSKRLAKFFLMNFRGIWDDLGTGDYHRYDVVDCQISKFRQMKNVNEVMKYSLGDVIYRINEMCRKWNKN